MDVLYISTFTDSHEVMMFHRLKMLYMLCTSAIHRESRTFHKADNFYMFLRHSTIWLHFHELKR